MTSKTETTLRQRGPYWILALLLAGASSFLLWPFFPALFFGTILSLALFPIVRKVESFGPSRTWATFLVLGTLTSFMFVPSLIFVIRGATLLTQTFRDPNRIQQIQTFIESLIHPVLSRLEQFNISDEQIRSHVTRALETGTQFGLKIFSDFISALPQIFLFSVVLVLATFVFLIGAEQFQNFFQRLFRMKDLQREKYVRIFQSCSQQVFLSNVLTGFLQSLVVTLGALLSGYPELFLIFFITFVTSFIPIIGAGPVALVLGIAGFLNQDYSAGIIMLITAGLAGSSDNVLRPYLATLGDIKVPVFLSFLSVLGGVLVFGLPGLFVGPLLISWAWGLLPVIYRDLFPAEVD